MKIDAAATQFVVVGGDCFGEVMIQRQICRFDLSARFNKNWFGGSKMIERYSSD